jgi:hypothetical protein
VPFIFQRGGTDSDAADSDLYVWGKIVIIAFSLDADIAIFNYLYLYCYNAYFSIIVFKLAGKIL